MAHVTKKPIPPPPEPIRIVSGYDGNKEIDQECNHAIRFCVAYFLGVLVGVFVGVYI